MEKEGRIPFEWGKYTTGKYDVVTRNGKQVEITERAFGVIYPIRGFVISENRRSRVSWGENGFYSDSGPEDVHDIFLVPKVEEVVLEAKVGDSQRGLYAAMALQGMLSNSNERSHLFYVNQHGGKYFGNSLTPIESLASKAVECADALIEELNKKGE